MKLLPGHFGRFVRRHAQVFNVEYSILVVSLTEHKAVLGEDSRVEVLHQQGKCLVDRQL